MDSTTERNGARETATRQHLTRKDWCQKALDVLAASGGEQPKVRQIARELGVTYGSFYHHFESADDFFRAILRYWQKDSAGRE